MKIIEWLFSKNKYCRRGINHYYAKKEGGIWRSQKLRNLHKKYRRVDADFGSYGWESDAFKGPVTVGKYCSFGPGVMRFEKNHLITGATTHPCLFNPSFGWVDSDERKETQLSIGNDVWIGANAIILPSVTEIGTGAVVAAGAVVTKNIPPYEIWAGVPAKKVKDRFDDNTKEELLNAEWWNIEEELLKSIKDQFKDTKAFLYAINEIKMQRRNINESTNS